MPSQQQQQQQQQWQHSAWEGRLMGGASNGLIIRSSSKSVKCEGKVVLCSTDGNVHLMQQQQKQQEAADEPNELRAASQGELNGVGSENSAVAQSVRLPGEVFSSPVCLGPWVVLGCRDDYLYCLKHGA
jgi:hypothetical protein